MNSVWPSTFSQGFKIPTSAGYEPTGSILPAGPLTSSETLGSGFRIIGLTAPELGVVCWLAKEWTLSGVGTDVVVDMPAGNLPLKFDQRRESILTSATFTITGSNSGSESMSVQVLNGVGEIAHDDGTPRRYYPIVQAGYSYFDEADGMTKGASTNNSGVAVGTFHFLGKTAALKTTSGAVGVDLFLRPTQFW